MITRKIVRAFLRLQDKDFEPEGILDIGAFQGDFAIQMRKIFPDAHIVMIEPLDAQKQVLENICNELEDVEYLQALVGEDERTVDFHYIDIEKYPQYNQTGSSKYKENNTYPFETKQIQQTTLDKLLEGDTNKYDLLKMDVQGAELDVLRGAKNRLADVEAILMEVSLVNYNESAPLMHDVMNTMHELGFVLFDIADEIRVGVDDDLFQVDAIFLRPDSKYRPQPPFA